MGPEGRARIMAYRKSGEPRRSPFGLNGAHAAERDATLFDLDYRETSLSLEPRNERGDVDYREPLTSRSPLRGLSRELRRPERHHSPPQRRRPPEHGRRRSPEALYDGARGLPRRSRSPRHRRPRSLSPPRLRRSLSPGGRRGGPPMHPDKRAMLRRCFCVKVTNVPPGTVYSELWARFKPHATVAFVEMLPAERAALVYLPEPEQREQVLVDAERVLQRGMRLEAWEGGSAALPAPAPDAAHPRACRTLLLGNLDRQLSRKDLRAAFQGFGPIVDVEIRRLPRAAAYYALVQFASLRGAVRALREMDGAPLGGLRLRATFGLAEPGPCVCARGLAPGLSPGYIQQRFGRYGAVDKVVYNPQQRAALVLFRSAAEAQAAVAELQAGPAEGVYLDYADEHFQLFFCKGMQARGMDPGDFLFL